MGDFHVLRTIEEIVEEESHQYQLVLDLEDKDKIYWTDEANQKTTSKTSSRLFSQYNPNLKYCLDDLLHFKGDAMVRSEIATFSHLDFNQVKHYLFKIRPELIEEKRKPIPLDNVYVLLSDFMPIIENWLIAAELEKKLKGLVTDASILNYCHRGLVESRHFLRKWWISPVGENQLNKLMYLENAETIINDGWATVTEIAKELKVHSSIIKLYCLESRIPCQKLKNIWRIPLTGQNQLRELLDTKEELIYLDDKPYYYIGRVAKLYVRVRGKDPAESDAFRSNFYARAKRYPDIFNPIHYRGRLFVNKQGRNLFCDLMKFEDAKKESGLSDSKLSRLRNQGVLKYTRLGPNRWFSYKSVQEYKATQTK